MTKSLWLAYMSQMTCFNKIMFRLRSRKGHFWCYLEIFYESYFSEVFCLFLFYFTFVSYMVNLFGSYKASTGTCFWKDKIPILFLSSLLFFSLMMITMDYITWMNRCFKFTSLALENRDKLERTLPPLFNFQSLDS